jgi:predicted transcriptional regulator
MLACIAFPAEREEQQSIVDHLVDTPNRHLTLLRVTSLAAATNALVRVRSHYPDVDIAKIMGGTGTTKDLQALELEVEEAAMEVMENIYFEGDDGGGSDQ